MILDHHITVERLDPEAPVRGQPAYTIGTLVTRKDQYADMTSSLKSGGFSLDDCEYLYIDNSGPSQVDAFRGLNAILNTAKAPYVILCHQDVRLLTDRRDALGHRLLELTKRDPNWAVAGNAGGVSPGKLALRITDPHGDDRHVGQLPERVAALDENFLVVVRDARVGFSHDLAGFHFYGADICLHAAQMGRTAYVIDFHLRHLSPGRKSHEFEAAKTAFRNKWSAALSPRWVQTTCALVHLSGRVGESKTGPLIERTMARLTRRMPGARGWQPTNRKTV